MLKHSVLDEETLKAEIKAEKKKSKEEKKAAKHGSEKADKKRIFVLDFHGDIKASATNNLRQEITTLLSLAQPTDEVVVRLESTGGMVHSYGLAASQLARINSKQIPLTVCVDKVAASGGYMMACVAHKVLAAPFAVIGSIGVIAQLPNFHRVLKNNNIDYEMLTAGEYKRTLTIFGENTDKAREKFVEDLEDTHDLFKDFVTEYRPVVDIAKVATGEVWYGRRALNMKLVDELKTSDEYLTDQIETADIYQVEFRHKKTLPEKLGIAAQQAVDRIVLTCWDRLQNTRWFT